MKTIVFDSDADRRARVAEQLRSLGHEVEGLAALPDALASVDLAVVGGDGRLGALERLRGCSRWLLAVCAPDEAAGAIAAGADDCVMAGAGADELAVRIAVADARGAFGQGDRLDGALPGVSGRQLRTMLDSLPIPVGVVSSEGRYLFGNGELERAFCCEPGGIVGRPLSDFFVNPEVWAGLERVKVRGRIRDHELEVRGPDGELRFVAGEAQWLPGPAGEGVALGTFVDITDRRRVEVALRKSEASLHSVLEASPDAIIVHAEGRYLFVNRAALAQLGLPPDADLVGESIYAQVKPDQVETVRERIAAMMTSGKPAPVRDLPFRRADGEQLLGEVASIPATFDGRPAIISIIRDVGEQRRIQSQLFLADRLATVGTLAVGVAHEINNPLAWVMGNLGLLADEFDAQIRLREQPGHDPALVANSRARVRELLGRAQEGTERVRRIVRDLGRFARPDEGAAQAVDIHALLDSTVEIADVQIRHRARLVRDYQATGFVRGSEARLGQVFLNLLVNAGQAIQPGAPRQNRVSVTTRDLDDDRIEITVADTGCGMPERVRQRIFEPFFTTKPVGEGTGIGLAISHSIIAAAGGEIVVESEVDRGTEFHVRLHRAEEDVPSRPAHVIRDESEPHRAAAPIARVLVIDDEPLIREMVCDALSAHEVTAVSNGRDALAQIVAADWDLILCDMILPEISGLELIRELEQRRPDALAKLVLMTGGDFSGKTPKLPDGARVRRLEKPFSIKSLRKLANSAV